MEDPRQLIGKDVRFFLDDQPLQLPAAQPVVMGIDLASGPDLQAAHYVQWDGSAFVTAPPPFELPDARDVDDFDHFLDFLYGDGSPAVRGILTSCTADGQPKTLPHPGNMTRQRRRAAARAASKGRTI